MKENKIRKTWTMRTVWPLFFFCFTIILLFSFLFFRFSFPRSPSCSLLFSSRTNSNNVRMNGVEENVIKRANIIRTYFLSGYNKYFNPVRCGLNLRFFVVVSFFFVRLIFFPLLHLSDSFSNIFYSCAYFFILFPIKNEINSWIR